MSVTVIDNTAFMVIKHSVRNFKEGIRRGLLEVAPEIERQVTLLIKSPPKTGKYYNIGGRVHQASAPGEAPADLTGRLADTVGSEVSSSTRLIIGDRAPYGKFLEGNFKNRIAPRPHLRPAALSKAREVKQAIEQGVKWQIGKK